MKLKAIIGGKIWTGTGKVINKGVILIDEGKIIAVGPDIKIPKNADLIKAEGKFVSPGFIDAHSHIGLVPEGLDWEYSDVNDFSGPLTPQLRAIDALDPYDIAFKDAISGGVTTVYTGPGSGNVIGGIGFILKTNGKIVKEEAALKMALGPKREKGVKSKEPYPTTRMGTVALLRGIFITTKKWLNGEIKGEEEKKSQYENVAKVLKGELMAKIHLSTSPDEIRAALSLIKEFGIRASIDHVFGGDLLADEIVSSGVPVIYGPPMLARSYSGFKYMHDKIPVILDKKGALVALMTDHPVVPQKHLRLLASVVVKNGLDIDKSLKMITINPARILGIDQQVGSLEIGKDADVVISSDHPLQITSAIEMVLINGEIVFEKSILKERG
jgi:imidazolonepropionase-like amidohydrolase